MAFTLASAERTSAPAAGLQLVIFAQDIGYRFVKIRRRLPRVEEVFERAQVLL